MNRELGQLVIVDTPGVHRPRTLLGERLNELVADVLADVDLIALCLPADEPIGPGDRRLIESIAENRAKRIAVITKTDRVGKQQLAQKLIEVSQLGDWHELVPVSAVAGDQVELLADLMLRLMPEAPLLYPAEQATDETDEQRICELVREAALELVRDELPHSIAVTLDEIVTKGNKPEIFVSLWVERDSQKGIIIGGQGSRLKAIGIAARTEIETLLGQPVILRIQVRIAKEWQRDSKQLGKLGM